MFRDMEAMFERPGVFEGYTARELWTDEHTSERMLRFHLDGQGDISSRNAAFIERSVEWIVEHFGVRAGTKIADFGCGPGLYAAKLARRGAEVTGIDFSPRSIGYAREHAEKEGLSIRYVNEDYLEYETDERFDLIVMIMCDYCALSPGQRGRMLGKFGRFLADRGAVLLDVYSLNAFGKRQERAVCEENLMDGFWSGEKYYGFLNAFKYGDEKVVLDKYTIVEEGRTRAVYNWLQYFSGELLEAEFATAGLRVAEWFADVAGTAYDAGGDEFAVVGRRQK